MRSRRASHDDNNVVVISGSTERKSRGVHRKWWLVTAAAVVVGGALGSAVAFTVGQNSNIDQGVTSGRLITSTAGVYSKLDGSTPPDFTVSGLRDSKTTLSLSQFKGKPTVLNFWASWCPPCRKEMPALEAVAQKFQGKVNFVGIDSNDQRSAGLAFALQKGVTYALGFDPSASVASSFTVYGLPSTFFISADGKLMGKQIGGMTQSRLEQLLSTTFGITATTQ